MSQSILENPWLTKYVGGQTLLHYAARNNSKEIGEVLISKGANINAIDIIYLNIIGYSLILFKISMSVII